MPRNNNNNKQDVQTLEQRITSTETLLRQVRDIASGESTTERNAREAVQRAEEQLQLAQRRLLWVENIKKSADTKIAQLEGSLQRLRERQSDSNGLSKSQLERKLRRRARLLEQLRLLDEDLGADEKQVNPVV